MSGGRASKNRRKGTCAYCGRRNVAIEDEHVFPDSWYPDGFPPSAMLLVPACRKCNGDFGRVEERLFLPLVAGLPYDDPAIRTIIDRALRSVDPKSGRNISDVSHRAARRRSIERRFELVTGREDSGTVWTPAIHPLTNVRTPAGLVVRGTPAVRFDPDQLTRLGIKFLKGCYYAAKKTPLRPDAICEARTFSRDPKEELWAAKDWLGRNSGGHWPFEFAYAWATEDDAVTIWWFVLWGHIHIVAWSSSPEHEAESNGTAEEHP